LRKTKKYLVLSVFAWHYPSQQRDNISHIEYEAVLPGHPGFRAIGGDQGQE
jgi:hypothetical protein